ncbi:DUF3099 domain-containing protein [Agromyces sp. NPDC055520]
MKQQQSITTLPPSPEAERRSRMIKYTIAMSIRVLCVVALLFAKGWWLAVFAVGAIVLPYFAVVLANVGSANRQRSVLRPGGLIRRTPPPSFESPAEPPADTPAEPRRDTRDDQRDGDADARDADERGAA